MQGTVLVERDRAAFAHLCAEAAAHAFCSVEGDLGVEVDRLRIGAPEAVQTAALEKDCGAHPSAVMNGALLNVYYSPSQFFHINLPSIFLNSKNACNRDNNLLLLMCPQRAQHLRRIW